MAYSYQDFESAANAAGLLGNFSQWDLDLAQRHPEAGLSLLSLKQDYGNATTDEQRLLANEAANEIRKSYGGYTAGSDGSKYYAESKYAADARALDSQASDVLGQIGSYGPFTWQNEDAYQQALNDLANRAPFSYDQTAPVYDNAYAEMQQRLLDAVLNREDFSWSKETDPLWGSYKKSYLREGERATANALGQASAASGGRASSYAVNAATQAGDYYATKLNDVIPTLYQQAYDRYLNEYQMKLSDLNAVNTQEQMDYNRYLTELGQFNTDRNFALNQYESENAQRMNALNALLNERSQAYNEYLGQYDMLQSYLGNLTGRSDTMYGRALDEAVAQRQAEQDALDRATLGAGYGDYSGLDALGFDTNNARAAWDLQQEQQQTQLDIQKAQLAQMQAETTMKKMGLDPVSVYADMQGLGVTDYNGALAYFALNGFSVADAQTMAQAYMGWVQSQATAELWGGLPQSYINQLRMAGYDDQMIQNIAGKAMGTGYFYNPADTGAGVSAGASGGSGTSSGKSSAPSGSAPSGSTGTGGGASSGTSSGASSGSAGNSRITNLNGDGWVQLPTGERMSLAELQDAVNRGAVRERQNADGTYTYTKR